MIDETEVQAEPVEAHEPEVAPVQEAHPAHGLLSEIVQHFNEIEAGVRSFSRDELAWVKEKLALVKTKL